MAREGIVSKKGQHKRTRLFSGVSGRRPDNHKSRVTEGNERREAWEKLGPKGQLAALDTRLGRGVGAAKQRARLQNLIDNPPRLKKVAKEETTSAPVEGGSGHLKAKDQRAAERAKRPGADARRS